MDSVDGATYFEGDINNKNTQIYIPEYFKLNPVDIVNHFDILNKSILLFFN